MVGKERIIRLTESQLTDMVKDIVLRLMEEGVDDSLNVEYLYRDDLLDVSRVLWDILQTSYKMTEIGELLNYKNETDFENKLQFGKIVRGLDDEIIACATYSGHDAGSSYKMVAIGCNQTPQGKEGLKAIIRDDINSKGLRFWVEASGAIESYFKKFGGDPLPRSIVFHALNKKSRDILPVPDKDDMVHYQRKITGVHGDDMLITKMIFGFRNDKIYKRAINAVENYGNFKAETNQVVVTDKTQMMGNVSEGIRDNMSTLCLSKFELIEFVVNNIYEAHYEGHINEMIPLWHKAIDKSLDLLNYVRSKGIKDPDVDEVIAKCEYLLENVPPLTLCTFD